MSVCDILLLSRSFSGWPENSAQGTIQSEQVEVALGLLAGQPSCVLQLLHTRVHLSV